MPHRAEGFGRTLRKISAGIGIGASKPFAGELLILVKAA